MGLLLFTGITIVAVSYLYWFYIRCNSRRSRIRASCTGQLACHIGLLDNITAAYLVNTPDIIACIDSFQTIQIGKTRLLVVFRLRYFSIFLNIIANILKCSQVKTGKSFFNYFGAGWWYSNIGKYAWIIYCIYVYSLSKTRGLAWQFDY